MNQNESEGLGEAAVVDRTEHQVAVDALDHPARAFGPVAGRGRGDPAHHLGVAALVDAVLGPRSRVVLGARDLDARHVAPPRVTYDAVRVRVPSQVADDVLA